MIALDGVKAIGALGAVVIPGWALARALGLGRGFAERIALAIALGRLLLGAVTLAGAAAGWSAAVPVWCALAWIGATTWAARRLATGRSAPAGDLEIPRRHAWILAALVAVSLVVTLAVVGRAGIAAPDGSLVFLGRHATADTLVYTAHGAQAAAWPLPFPNPFVEGALNRGHSLFFATLAGLAAATGLDPLDVGFRLRPALDLGALVVTAFALALRLGASAAGAGLGAFLVLVGGGLSEPLFWIARALGTPLAELELWAFGTSFIAPFNPVAPGAQTAWCALLLLAGAVDAPRRRSSRTAAVVAGLLVASVFELKATLWVSLLPALVLVAARARPGSGRGAMRLAALVALLASLPLVLASPAVVPSEGDAASSALRFCFACFPRFAVGSAVQDPMALVRLFELFEPGDLLQPRFWIGSIGASALYLGLTLGTRLFAWPARIDAAEAPGAAAAARTIGLGLAFGAAMTLLVDTPPHFVNAGQFAWAASLGAWPLLGVRLGRWIDARRFALAATVVALALPTGLAWIATHGIGAPEVDRVSVAEQAFAAAVARETPRDALVLEPSLLVTPTRTSVLAWLAERRLYASKAGMLAYLEPAERARRIARLERVYLSRDRAEAELALAETGAGWVVTSDGVGSALDGSAGLRRAFGNEAGTLWQVIAPRPAP